MLLKLVLLLVTLAPVPAPPPPDPLGSGYLGVKAAQNGIGVPGLVLAEVVDGGPAARAGLRPQDELVQVGKLRPKRFDEVQRLVYGQRPGTKLAVEVLRNGKPVALTLVVGERPGDLPQPQPADVPPGVPVLPVVPAAPRLPAPPPPPNR